MTNNAKIGFNRTGLQMAPLGGTEQVTASDEIPADIVGDRSALAHQRSEYGIHADRIGSVPVPGTFKGVANTLIKKLTGKNIEVLIDKLGERLAFERTGTRLYDALIAKATAMPKVNEQLRENLQQFRKEELQHFKLVSDALEALGADPTAQTPCADVVGVASLGLVQVITEPRTNLAQALNALLTAELTDNAGWELLIQLATQLGQTQLVADFEKALDEERNHLHTIRSWLEHELLNDAS